MDSLWLSEKQLKDFTGIRMGERDSNGNLITYNQLQAEFLRERGIPFFQNARGRCLVSKEVALGSKTRAQPRPKWQPKIVRGSL